RNQPKTSRPADWYVARRRAPGLPVGNERLLVGGTTRLGEPLWRPPAPKGFADDNGAWLDGLAHRLDSANAFAQSTVAERLDAAAGVENAPRPPPTHPTRPTPAPPASQPHPPTLRLLAPPFPPRGTLPPQVHAATPPDV